MTGKQADEQAREARNRYQREWRAKNKDKCKAIRERYWMKKALAELERRTADGQNAAS